MSLSVDEVRPALATRANAARRTARSDTALRLARVGFVARGAVYLLVGWLALQAAVGTGAGVTDKQGALEAVGQHPLGTFALVLVAAGLLAYAVWGVVRAVFDPEGSAHGRGGPFVRIGFAIAAASYAALGLGAARLALGLGSVGRHSDEQTRDWTARVLETPVGPPLVMAVGAAVMGFAIVEFGRAVTASFQRRMGAHELGPLERKWLIRAGRAGHAARGVVFGLIGVFLFMAARHDDPNQAVGLGGALVKLTEQSEGPLLLGLVAAGLCMYGLFSFAEAKYRRLT
jgi:hypothetical protein